jgi:lysozyme
MINTIIDIYHQNNIDFGRVRDAGIIAIIHKATQGTSFRDSEYRDRHQRAKDMGFLFGAYHFSSGDNVLDQVEHFLSFAQPDDSDLIALDFEPSTHGPDMTIQQARQFVTLIRNELGRYPVIYGGNLIREGVDTSPDPVLANCPLWYARYRSRPIGIPTQVWPTYTLWQYTDGNNGDEPHTVDGIGRCDRNRYQGSTDELRAAWPLTRILGPVFPT